MPRKRAKTSLGGTEPAAESNEDELQYWEKPSPGVLHPDFATLNWKPIVRAESLSDTGLKQGITISLPFSGVDLEDVPEVLEKFGGLDKIATNLRQTREVRRELSFSLNPKAPQPFRHPNVLSRIPASNSFVLEVECTEPVETDQERDARARKELSVVQRALQTQLKPLPPINVGAKLTHFIDVTYEFDKLFDYEICPAVVKNSTVIDPDGSEHKEIRLKSIVHNILPSLPFSEESDPENIFLYFPSVKFANQSSFTCPDYIPSLYRDPLTSFEKMTQRLRANFAKKMQWLPGSRPVIPDRADIRAEENISIVDKVVIDAARQMLAEQPIWRRDQFYHSLKTRLPVGKLLKEHQRFILPALTFRCTKGPWSRMWCRYGYDPLSDSESRKYQTIDYRINAGLVHKKRTISSKKPSMSESAALLRKMFADFPKSGDKTDSARGLQQIVQLLELTCIAGIKHILDDPDRVRDVCDVKEGHFVEGTMDDIRLEITKAIEREDPELLNVKGLVARAQVLGFCKNLVLPEAGQEDDSGSEDDN